MLALIQLSDSSVVKEVMEGSTFTIGSSVTSPAYAEWSNSTHILKTIVQADPIPVGYVGTMVSVVVTNMVPKYVWSTVPRVVTSDEVNTERDRRIAKMFVLNGKSYAMDGESKARIIGAATLAGFAVAAGAPAGFYKWHGGTSDFVWIADDNTLTRMDAQSCFAFGQAAAAWETKCIFAGRAIKQNETIPVDYTNDSYWPVSGQ